MGIKPHIRMPASERAKQFLSFAALRELPEALEEQERVRVPRRELSEEAAEFLDRKLAQVRPGQIVTAVYYRDGEYVQITGMAAIIDRAERVLCIADTRIRLEDLLSVRSGLEKEGKSVR